MIDSQSTTQTSKPSFNFNFLKLSSQRIDTRQNGFGWLRLFFAILVVFSHARYIGFGASEFGFNIDDIGNFLTIGSLGLFGFFIISGFLITGSFLNSADVFIFLKKRFLRLAPGYWACLFLTAFFFIPLYYILQGKSLNEYNNIDLSKSWNYVWSNIMFEIKTPGIGNILDNTFLKNLNGPLWTLIFEIRAYILLGLLGVFGIFRNKFLILIPAILFWFAHYNNVFTPNFAQWFGIWVGEFKLAILFSYFFIASAFYVWKDKIPMDWKLFVCGAGLTCLGVSINKFSLFAPLCLTYCVIYIAYKIHTPKWLSNLGDMSYGVYIYSWLIQNALLLAGFTKFDWNIFGVEFNWIIYSIFSIIFSLIAGWMSYHLVEKRFLPQRKTI